MTLCFLGPPLIVIFLVPVILAEMTLRSNVITSMSSGCCAKSAFKFNYNVITTNDLHQWWSVKYSEYMYVTWIKIYHCEDNYNYAGFLMTIENGTNVVVPPVGHRCKRRGKVYSTKSEFVDCNHSGDRIIYYREENGIRNCFIDVRGCPVGKWSTYCGKTCSSKCLSHLCHPKFGYCIDGCTNNFCVHNDCDQDEVCKRRCTYGRHGKRCNIEFKDFALEGYVKTHYSGSYSPQNVRDNNRLSHHRMWKAGNWLQVDLGVVIVVDTIYLHFEEYYKLESDSAYTGKHLIYGSNSSTDFRTNGIILHKDIIPVDDIEVNSSASFRYATYYPELDNSNVQMKISEFQVIGCHHGYYGNKCLQSCRAECIDRICHLHTGACLSVCIPGWEGAKCDKECDDYQFGVKCLDTCHCFSAPCNKSTGECPDGGCKKGYQGDLCNEACTQGHFGKDCMYYCTGCVMEQCEDKNGICNITDRCNPGWTLEDNGPKCDKRVTCPDVSISNGTQSFSDGLNYESTVTFGCSPGFKLNGETNATCTANSNWSTSNPTCTGIEKWRILSI